MIKPPKLNKKLATGIVWGDAHSPEEDSFAFRILKQVVRDVQPDYLIELGDGCELGGLSYWNKKKLLTREGLRAQKDIQRMMVLDEEIAKCVRRKNVSKYKFMGNHERWVDLYLEEHPELQGMEGLDIKGKFESRGWKVVPWGEFLFLGKLVFHHGDRKGYQQKHHSSNWVKLGKNLIYGHRHDVQRFTQETLKGNGKVSRHAAFSIGCMRKLNPDWMTNRNNNWQTGFGIFYLLSTGAFNFYHVDIINRKAVWNGKIYQ